jgi:DNA repair and recombination protein RAD52
MDWERATTELVKKLNPDAVQAPKQFGPKGHYIEGWHAIAEANRIFGFGEWSYTVAACQCVSERSREIGKNKTPGFGVTYTATVRVDVGGVIREDIGAGHGYDVDCGLAHESAVKEAVTDALKRALRTFGNPFGLALYDKSRENVGVDEPPFNPEAAASRVKAKFQKAEDFQTLKGFWNDEYDTVKRIGETDKALGQDVYSVYTTMKNQLEEKEAA